ncbi:zinc finger CCCH-type antiviral protein 1 isoform X2 [Calypte anna]|uniref:zinc finger CCCH-type antiviral protein 1 isoform X2 n=1 Tax=Calypte anna TaxID=9244 RepID=UPI0011C46AD1|nr:zinc finger CCCH-type antiviral protein 1 isoform X2 [Calypte anna]
MSDPAVVCFITKTLCAQGGRMKLSELQQQIGLSAQQLEETLSAAGPQRFLVLRGSVDDVGVLAVSDVRLCILKECGGCERLHLCKLNLMGRCNQGSRFCKYSHDIISPENKKVLKTHQLSGLDENELQVLLLLNDPFFLPDVCRFYNRKDSTCTQQKNCSKLHVCYHFLHGQCRFFPCKRSHNLLDSHTLRLLEIEGISVQIASNMQTIYDHRHADFIKELRNAKTPHNNRRANVLKKTAVSRSQEQLLPLKTGITTPHVPPSGDEKDKASAKALEDKKEDNCDEICIYYVWKYCKNNDKCPFNHYHLPYRWQVYNGTTWKDLSMMEDIEKAYCDPKNNSMAGRNIDFQTMTCDDSLVRRLSTPSSVSKPTFTFTTKWIWYWKNDLGQWIEYGDQGEGSSVNSPSSDTMENLYLSDPNATIDFKAEMTQTNSTYKTKKQVRRRPKFVSFEDVQKLKKGQRESTISNQPCPDHWDPSPLANLRYKAVEISSTSSEYNKIKQLFLQTMNRYNVLKIRRIQNPSLWKVFQWQREQMKRENGGREVTEKLLFHGTNSSFVETICIHNFDWRICGNSEITYGRGNYFSRDASYSHGSCQSAGKTNTMFVARVLVGDYVKGNTTYVRPPAKSADGFQLYDSCVDNELNPSIFVVFIKNQFYPEYTIEYNQEEEIRQQIHPVSTTVQKKEEIRQQIHPVSTTVQKKEEIRQQIHPVSTTVQKKEEIRQQIYPVSTTMQKKEERRCIIS